jgi:hypothetical protein
MDDDRRLSLGDDAERYHRVRPSSRSAVQASWNGPCSTLGNRVHVTSKIWVLLPVTSAPNVPKDALRSGRTGYPHNSKGLASDHDPVPKVRLF